MVEQEDGMSDSHRPQCCVGDVGPMDGRVKHHGASYIHRRLYGSLGNAGLMMGSGTSEAGDLREFTKPACETS
jgi:hypothetical protein